MKAFKKTDLEFVNGYLVHKDTGDVVALDNEIVELANELETRVQKAKFLDSEPEYCAGPDLSKFNRKHSIDLPYFETNTPFLDIQVAKSLAIMDEIDEVNIVDRMNEVIKGMIPLVMFTKEDTVLSIDGQPTLTRFDTPTLGNPLDWDENTVGLAIATYHGVNDMFNLEKEEEEEESDSE